jgi:hypothetical protein
MGPIAISIALWASAGSAQPAAEPAAKTVAKAATTSGASSNVHVSDVVAGLLDAVNEVNAVLAANHFMISKLGVSLQTVTGKAGQGELDLLVLSGKGGVGSTTTQELSFDIEPPSPTPKQVEAALDSRYYIKRTLKDSLAKNIAIAVLVREEARCASESALALKSFDTKLSFAVTKTVGGGVGFTILVFKVSAGATATSGATNTLTVSIAEDPHNKPGACATVH